MEVAEIRATRVAFISGRYNGWTHKYIVLFVVYHKMLNYQEARCRYPNLQLPPLEFPSYEIDETAGNKSTFKLQVKTSTFLLMQMTSAQPGEIMSKEKAKKVRHALAALAPQQLDWRHALSLADDLQGQRRAAVSAIVQMKASFKNDVNFQTVQKIQADCKKNNSRACTGIMISSISGL